VNEEAAPPPVAPAVDLTPDDIATTLGEACGVHDCYVAFKGFLGPPNACEMHRIYLDNTFCRWVEVHADDIRFRQDVPENERDQRSAFWIKRTARVIVCRIDKADEIQDDLAKQPDDAGDYRHPPW